MTYADLLLWIHGITSLYKEVNHGQVYFINNHKSILIKKRFIMQFLYQDLECFQFGYFMEVKMKLFIFNQSNFSLENPFSRPSVNETKEYH